MSTSNVWLQEFFGVLRGERGDVGDENVDSAKRLRAVGDEFLKRGLVGHVDAGPVGGHPFCHQVLNRGLHLVRVACADGDACAFLGENICSRAADAFGAAGHNRAQAFQSEIHVPLHDVQQKQAALGIETTSVSPARKLSYLRQQELGPKAIEIATVAQYFTSPHD